MSNIYHLKVTVLGIKPPIWRRLELSSATKLGQLHRILQIAFGWEDYHLHEFRFGSQRYGVPEPDMNGFGDPVLSEKSVRLSCVMSKPRQKMLYLYDFGDDWHVEILLESIKPPVADARYPRCIAGARSAPPEDSGGPWGYEAMLEALADPQHERHEELAEWCGPDFDPEAFSAYSITVDLLKRKSLAAKE